MQIVKDKPKQNKTNDFIECWNKEKAMHSRVWKIGYFMYEVSFELNISS